MNKIDMKFLTYNLVDGEDLSNFLDKETFDQIICNNIIEYEDIERNGKITSCLISVCDYETEKYIIKKFSYINEAGNIACNILSLDKESNKVYLGSEGANSSPKACFTGDTQVLTKEGLKNISELNIGDEVYSFNETINQVEMKEIDKFISHIGHDIYCIHIGDEIIKATTSHPFNVHGKGKTIVKDLTIGDAILTFNNELKTITNIQKLDKDLAVYEIRIKDNHNYFVGENSLFVYNEDSVLE